MNSNVPQLPVPHSLDGPAIHAWRGVAGKVEQFAAVIGNVPTGDYRDARYFVDRSVADSAPTAELSTQIETIPGLKRTHTATNLAELNNGTHLLPAGTVVQVFAWESRLDPAVKVYVFDLTPVLAVVVKI